MSAHTANIDIEAFKRMWAQGVGVREMSERLLVSTVTVRAYRHSLGLPDRDTDPMPHSKETIERVRVLWMDGKSGTEIARTLGGTWTRNKVMGIVLRNKMSRPERGPSSFKQPKVKKPRVSRPKPEKLIMDRAIKPPKTTTPKAAEGLVTGVAFPPLSPEEADKKRAAFAAEGKRTIKGMDAVANDNAVLLMERKFGQCAWPVGTPDRPRNQLVCGQPVFDGVEKCSYCLTHAKRAFARDVSQPKPKDNLARAVRSWAA